MLSSGTKQRKNRANGKPKSGNQGCSKGDNQPSMAQLGTHQHSEGELKTWRDLAYVIVQSPFDINLYAAYCNGQLKAKGTLEQCRVELAYLHFCIPEDEVQACHCRQTAKAWIRLNNRKIVNELFPVLSAKQILDRQGVSDESRASLGYGRHTRQSLYSGDTPINAH